MSVPQYLRRISLKIGNDDEAIDLSNLRIRFKIKRGDRQTPNSADIRVYNIDKQTANKVTLKEFTRVVLQAGYADNFGVIFDGTVTQAINGREGQVNTFLQINAADGDSAYNYAILNRSLAAGSTPDDHHQAAVESMAEHGVVAGYKPDLPSNTLPRGKVLFGMARNILDTMVRTAAAKWSIQDGKLNVIPLNDFIPCDPLSVSFATGLIDTPGRTGDSIKLKMLLNPSAKIGQLLSVEETVDMDGGGLYYLMVADHDGDTRDVSWYTTALCLAVDATQVSGDISKRLRVKSVQGPIKTH
jgi:hypothetical protein